jgi:hypothetical protein
MRLLNCQVYSGATTLRFPHLIIKFVFNYEYVTSEKLLIIVSLGRKLVNWVNLKWALVLMGRKPADWRPSSLCGTREDTEHAVVSALGQ